LATDRTFSTCAAQITEHRFTEARRLRQDRLIAKSVALAKWKKARPELFPDSPIGARDVLPGENWIFPDHRTLADVIEAEQTSARVLSKAS
jgi:hypothetical protein